MITEEKINLGSIEINVKHNLTDKPVVFFIHFSGGNLHMWDGVLPQFERGEGESIV